jgi:hypothetical protein
LNFYIAESKAILFCEQLHMLWKNAHDIEWIDDTEHITMICINDQYGSRARVIRAIILFIDDIYVTNNVKNCLIRLISWSLFLLSLPLQSIINNKNIYNNE